MAYLYQEVWNKIKVNMQAEITVSKDRASTVIQGVKRTKSLDNAHRGSVGLIPFSKLVIRQEDLNFRGMIKITFRLLYDTRL